MAKCTMASVRDAPPSAITCSFHWVMTSARAGAAGQTVASKIRHADRSMTLGSFMCHLVELGRRLRDEITFCLESGKLWTLGECPRGQSAAVSRSCDLPATAGA